MLSADIEKCQVFPVGSKIRDHNTIKPLLHPDVKREEYASMAFECGSCIHIVIQSTAEPPVSEVEYTQSPPI